MKPIQECDQTDPYLGQREWQSTLPVWSAPSVDETKPVAGESQVRSARLIDFFQARDWLLAGLEGKSKESEALPKADNGFARRLPSIGKIDRLEQSLYWFLSAATLIYLLYDLVVF